MHIAYFFPHKSAFSTTILNNFNIILFLFECRCIVVKPTPTVLAHFQGWAKHITAHPVNTHGYRNQGVRCGYTYDIRINLTSCHIYANMQSWWLISAYSATYLVSMWSTYFLKCRIKVIGLYTIYNIMQLDHSYLKHNETSSYSKCSRLSHFTEQKSWAPVDSHNQKHISTTVKYLLINHSYITTVISITITIHYDDHHTTTNTTNMEQCTWILSWQWW